MTTFQIQCYLGILGYLGPMQQDDDYGPETAAAVKKFQQDYSLEADGIAGPVTEKMLIGVVSGTVARKEVSDNNVGNISTQSQNNLHQTNTVVQDACKYLQSDGYYHIQKGADVQLSEHFKSSEFDCHGIGCCTETVINPKLVDYLEMIRNHFGMPVTLTSAYRCPVHNSAIHGATGSHHCRGNAADIVVRNHTPRTVSRFAEEAGILGIGLYETNGDGHFVHVDTRSSKAFWYGQSQQYRSTFK